MNGRFVRNVLLKAVGLFLLMNIAMGLFQPVEALNKLSIYNSIVPGRERFPFGEDPASSYNLTINNLDAMFSSHVISQPKQEDEFRVVLLGDSSVWGTLLRPEETLSGMLNILALTSSDNRQVKFYNLGYPTLSLWKDVLILEKALDYDPDLIIWIMTLESFPGINPQESPLISANQKALDALMGTSEKGSSEGLASMLRSTVIGSRRELADWLRLQLYGVMWAATGLDQNYPDTYEPAQRDLENDASLNGIPSTDMSILLDSSPIDTGLTLAGDIPLMIVNEPILISAGENSDIRYNFYYPRWAYDGYRDWLIETTQQNNWVYLDAWDLVGEQEFTNSAIHLTVSGEEEFAAAIGDYLKTAYPPLFP